MQMPFCIHKADNASTDAIIKPGVEIHYDHYKNCFESRNVKTMLNIDLRWLSWNN